jgi:hypothetical protein
LVLGWPIAAIASRTLATIILKGAPPLRPRARAEARPALVRSEISSRSNSESAAKNAEDQLARWCGRVNGGTVGGEDFEANALLCQIVHRIHQMTQVAAESIEFPDNQGIARAKSFERGFKAGTSIQPP